MWRRAYTSCLGFAVIIDVSREQIEIQAKPRASEYLCWRLHLLIDYNYAIMARTKLLATPERMCKASDAVLGLNDDVGRGTSLSYAKAATLFAVPRQTLHDRVSRLHKPAKVAHREQMLLSPATKPLPVQVTEAFVLC